MTATNHILTGASIGLLISNPYIALPFAFISHFILDALPHFGIPGGAKIRNKSRLFRGVLAADLIIGTLIIGAIVASFAFSDWLVISTMFLAMSPDFVWGYHFFHEEVRNTQRPKTWFSKLHSKIQWFEKPQGLIIEILFMFFMMKLFISVL